MSHAPIRVGLFLLGVGPSPSGVWTRLRDMVGALSGETELELYAAVTSESERDLLALPPERTLLLPPIGLIQRVVHTSRAARAFVSRFDLDVLQVESMPIPQRASVPMVVSLHDLREFDSPAWKIRSAAEVYRRTMMPRHARRVDAIFSLTLWMKQEIELYLSTDNVQVIPPIAPKAETPSRPPWRGAETSLFNRPFLLALGHLEPRKNLEVLIRASNEPTWPNDLQLVIAGADHGSLPTLRQLASTSPASIHFLGPINDNDKWWLLTHAAVVAVPSLIEGFGIVALESIVAGTPVLVADAAALPEVVGDRRAILDPHDHVAWGQRIRDVVGDPKFRTSVVEHEAASLPRHTSVAVASQLLSVYRNLVTPV